MTELDNNLLITIPIKNLKFTKSRLGEILTLNQRIKITNFLNFFDRITIEKNLYQ